MILAPALMTAEKDPKKAAQKCFDSVGLDSDSYRIGHTKARKLYPKIICLIICQILNYIFNDFTVFPKNVMTKLFDFPNQKFLICF